MTIRFFLDDISTACYGLKVLITNLMTDNLLYLKFFLDPIVYAWRMPKYRESFGKISCPHKDIGGESKLTGIERSTTELNQSAITLLSSKLCR